MSVSFGARIQSDPIKVEKNIDAPSSYFMLKMSFERIDPITPAKSEEGTLMLDPHCHSSSIMVERPAALAFELMSDGLKQGSWAWGSFDRREVEPGLFCGTSIFSGKETYVRLYVDRDRLQVDYEVGGSKEAMQFRNMSRVIPGNLLKMGPDTCVVTLLTWRLQTQTDAEWTQFGTIHEAEMFLIKGLLERE
ncbi:hypothetical protein [Rhizobium sp. RCAM05973]|uniref:hypothetical protein n=1 Tax=Rhizobium sp. RCAM05973 TaxID=2994066 RepID=UPI0022EBD249|nr:hypothetical protein [Rhizobium sp. RCAM05973]